MSVTGSARGLSSRRDRKMVTPPTLAVSPDASASRPASTIVTSSPLSTSAAVAAAPAGPVPMTTTGEPSGKDWLGGGKGYRIALSWSAARRALLRNVDERDHHRNPTIRRDR